MNKNDIMLDNLAFVFPGQGSQSVSMLSDIIATYDKAKKILNIANEILEFDLENIINNNPDNLLNLTEYTQPVMLVADYIMWQYWCDHTPWRPKLMAGHSLGEYMTLIAAEVISFTDALFLITKRAKFMQQAVDNGAMAAIVSLNLATVEKICQQISQDNDFVAVANINSATQIVISGHNNAVEKVIFQAKQQGAKIAKKIAVSVPAHCKLLQNAAEKFTTYLTKITFKKPQISIINNANLNILTDIQDIKNSLMQQIYSPVNWLETINIMTTSNIKMIVECGPNKILTAQNKRINREIICIALNSVKSLDLIKEHIAKDLMHVI